MALNPERKAAWIAALRSGEYAQSKMSLHDGVGFCCLGVACDIWRKSPDSAPLAPEWRDHGVDGFALHFGDNHAERAILPGPVHTWMGADDAHGGGIPRSALTGEERRAAGFEINGETLGLPSLNDAGIPFSRIADLIEAHL